jgi:hypothetical protein
VREIRTPVNMGNQPHRDNGEAVVGIIHRPLLYPLREPQGSRTKSSETKGSDNKRCGCSGSPILPVQVRTCTEPVPRTQKGYELVS